MLTRTLSDPQDGTETTALVCGSLEEGFREIAADAQGMLDRFASVLFEVYCDPGQVPAHCLEALRSVSGDSASLVQVSPAGHNPFFAARPRATVSFTAATWARVHQGSPVGLRHVGHEWTVMACPPGEDPAAHEIAETLMWDADAAGEFLDEDEALALARALVR